MLRHATISDIDIHKKNGGRFTTQTKWQGPLNVIISWIMDT